MKYQSAGIGDSSAWKCYFQSHVRFGYLAAGEPSEKVDTEFIAGLGYAAMGESLSSIRD